MDVRYSAEDFRLAKPIFNKIRKYPAAEIIAACINKIHYAEQAPHPRFDRYQPWTLLLLIKWTLLHGDLQGAFPRVVFGEDEFNHLLNDLFELDRQVDGRVAASRDEKGWFLYFRKKAFQQFPFQEPIYQSRFGRQYLLFGYLHQDDRLRRKFVDRVGVDIEHFLDMTFTILMRLDSQKEPFVTQDWFGTLTCHYPPNTVRLFLRELSKDFSSVRHFLLAGRNEHAPELKYELAEMSPLKRFPLLKLGEKYFCYSPKLTYRSLECCVYDILRDDDPQSFGNHFGKIIFEQYVGRAVGHSQLTTLTEQELQTELGQRKTVDYLLIDGDAHIYIDAKAVEATYIGEVTEDPEIIFQRVDHSVIKGIEQAYSLAQDLDGMTNIGKVPLGEPKARYLLIVTFKDLYLGCGRDFYHYIARNKLDEILQRYGTSPRIPFEHIYVISIEDFELLVHAVYERRIGMAEFLRRAVAADSTSFFEKRRLVFRQHLYDMLGDLVPPTHLDEPLDEMPR